MRDYPVNPLGELHIDLDAVGANYHALGARLADTATCGACVKANGYGLGRSRIATTLYDAGCRDFFVACAEEGVRLRNVLPDGRIHVFSGLCDTPPETFSHHGLTPVLNSLDQIRIWARHCDDMNTGYSADIHVDTGMCRLGLSPPELVALSGEPGVLNGMSVDIVMSHLACADEPDHPMNRLQLDAYQKARKVLPMGRGSLCNSSGVFLGPEYHFDIARPGAALYGINPVPERDNPMSQVVELWGKILQLRSVDTPETVGYGATHQITGPGRVATIGVGYADGYRRALSGRGTVFFDGHSAPVIGRVSMDMITVDVTHVPDHLLYPCAAVELIGENQDVDAVAVAAGTIGYEVLTTLGERCHRIYVGGEGCR